MTAPLHDAGCCPFKSLDEVMAELPIALARPWPNGVPAGNTPNDRGECDSCRWPLRGNKVWWHGAWFHDRCAAEHERLILGEDAGPGLAEQLDAIDALDGFLARLGKEAAAIGLDSQRLATAIERANHG
jgi:hypothetical protein